MAIHMCTKPLKTMTIPISPYSGGISTEAIVWCRQSDKRPQQLSDCCLSYDGALQMCRSGRLLGKAQGTEGKCSSWSRVRATQYTHCTHTCTTSETETDFGARDRTSAMLPGILRSDAVRHPDVMRFVRVGFCSKEAMEKLLTGYAEMKNPIL